MGDRVLLCPNPFRDVDLDVTLYVQDLLEKNGYRTYICPIFDEVEDSAIPEHIEKHYMNLAIERKLVMQQKDETTQIYSSVFYHMEANTAHMLKQLDVSYKASDAEIEKRIRRIEKQTDIELDEQQINAVKEAVRNGLLIITGGPGTGKTTTINTIIRYFEMEGLDIFLAAPITYCKSC